MYNSFTLKKLKEIAKGYDIPKYYQLNKQDLIIEIEKKVNIINEEYLQKHEDSEYTIYVKSMMGSCVNYYVSKTDTILSLKEKIESKTNLPVNNQKIYRHDYITNTLFLLEDKKTFEYYNIGKESTLSLFFTLDKH